MLLIKIISMVWNHLGDREEKGDREGAANTNLLFFQKKNNTNLLYHAKLIFNFPWTQSVCDAKGPGGHCRICRPHIPTRVFSFQEVQRRPGFYVGKEKKKLCLRVYVHFSDQSGYPEMM